MLPLAITTSTMRALTVICSIYQALQLINSITNTAWRSSSCFQLLSGDISVKSGGNAIGCRLADKIYMPFNECANEHAWNTLYEHSKHGKLPLNHIYTETKQTNIRANNRKWVKVCVQTGRGLVLCVIQLEYVNWVDSSNNHIRAAAVSRNRRAQKYNRQSLYFQEQGRIFFTTVIADDLNKPLLFY